MASTVIYRTLSGATDNHKFTTSIWFKRSNTAQNGKLFFTKYNGSNYFTIHIEADGIIEFMNVSGGTGAGYLKTSHKCMDSHSWYHLVCQWNAADATESNRMKMWINGVQQTSFSSHAYPSQNQSNYFCSDSEANGASIGGDKANANGYFDGYLSHAVINFGETYQATDYGEYNSTDGIWQPKLDLTGLTFDSKSLWLKMEDSTDMDKDSSGNNISLTTDGTLTSVKDSPSNNFATWNRELHQGNSSHDLTYANGNNKITSADNNPRCYSVSSLAMPRKGKYYAEFKLIKNDGVTQLGIADSDIVNNRFHYNNAFGSTTDAVVWQPFAGQIVYNNSDVTTGYTLAVNNDIAGVAVDMDNEKIYFYLQGTLLNTGGTDFSSYVTGQWTHFCIGDNTTSGNDHCEANFGNGIFGTTAIASAGTNASGQGSFEFDVPAGFTALCTKGINSF